MYVYCLKSFIMLLFLLEEEWLDSALKKLQELPDQLPGESAVFLNAGLHLVNHLLLLLNGTYFQQS